MSVQLTAEVERYRRLSLAERHADYDRKVREAVELDGADRTAALDFNARFVTALREADVPLFGVKP